MSKTTFHRLNRYFLLTVIPVSLVFPLLKFSGILHTSNIPEINWIGEFSGISMNHFIKASGETSSYKWALSGALGVFYWVVTGFLFFRFLFRMYRIFRLKYISERISGGRFLIIYTNRYNAPFSFFNWIFIPTGFTGLSEYDTVLEHEKVHARQFHSADLIISELFCITFWFNPFAYMLKRSLKNIHEYLADHAAIHARSNVREYLRLLVSGTEFSSLSGITNHFKCHTIKKRIDMINRNNTSAIRRFTYLLILPFIFFSILAFTPRSAGNHPPSIRPVAGDITLHFGFEGKNPVTKEFFRHEGVDIRAREGTAVIAPASGLVIEAANKKDRGNYILIRHDDVYETFYAHLQDISVKKGESISAGQELGHVGTTGYSTGPHLHYEVIKKGVRVDPEDYFKH